MPELINIDKILRGKIIAKAVSQGSKIIIETEDGTKLVIEPSFKVSLEIKDDDI